MLSPEDPPGFVVRTEAEKAAWENGFRLKREIENGWLRFGSTTAKCEIWIAGVSRNGPWLLSIDRSEVVKEIGASAKPAVTGPGAATLLFDGLGPLYDTLKRAYRLGLSLPDLPRPPSRICRGLPRSSVW